MKTRVSIVKCRTYNPEEAQFSVEKAFDLLGGIGSFVKAGERVLVKPNVLSGSPPERGVNTHVEIVRSVIRIIKQCGAVPVIGDNPGGSVAPKEVYETSGMAAISKEEQVELADVKGIRLIRGIPVAAYFLEYDKIINLPKMKTHSLMGLTGAVKNMYGAVAGLNKSECHKRFPKPEEFVNVLVDVFESVRPHLVLMDGVIAMHGYGPAAGKLKEAGVLIAGQDSVAVDAVFSHLIGIEPFDILTTKESHRRGLGQADIEEIEILGERIEDCIIKGFKLPRAGIVRDLLPGPIVRIMASYVKFKPCINVKLCKKCKICAESCPVKAVSINDSESTIDYQKCIRCMCCHEVCPYSAVGLRRNILARVLGL